MKVTIGYVMNLGLQAKQKMGIELIYRGVIKK